jgi:hypothetical protein
MTTTSDGRTGQPAGTEKRRVSRDRLLADLTVVEPSPAERRRAAVAVCHFNPDRDEARELLEALGLLDDAAIRVRQVPESRAATQDTMRAAS